MLMHEPSHGENIDLTDQTLLRRLKGGENDAATALYLRYAKRLERLATYQTSDQLANRIDSDEIVQSVFRTFFRRASKGHYDVSDSADLWKLLLVITLNKIRRAAEYHHAEKRDITRTKSFGTEYFDSKSKAVANHDAAYSTLKLTVDEMLANLPPKHQEMIRLRIEGFNLPEVATKTSRTQRTVERVLKSFRDKLLKLVEE